MEWEEKVKRAEKEIKEVMKKYKFTVDESYMFYSVLKDELMKGVLKQ